MSGYGQIRTYKKKRFLTGQMILLIFFLTTFIKTVSASENALVIETRVLPETLYSQLETGKNYTFQLSLINRNLTLMRGMPISSPEVLFSGNLIIKIKILLSKEGIIKYGTNKMIYGSQLGEFEQSSIVQLPEIGRQVESSFIYHCNQSYDLKNAALDEWLRVSLNIKIYGEVYSTQNGSLENATYFLGPELSDLETDYYYIVSNEKIQYIGDKVSEIDDEIESFLRYKEDIENKTGEPVNIDFSSMLKDYNEIKTLFEKGDYVSTSNAIEKWWNKPNYILLDYIILKLDQYKEYKSIAANIEDIKLDYIDELYYKELELKQLRDAENLYIYAIIALAILSIALFAFRFKNKNRDELDVIDRAKLLIGKK